MGFQWLHGFAVSTFGPAGQTHHHRLAGAVNIGVQQTHTRAFSGQGQRQIGGGGGFADAAFARSHGNDVFHLRQQGHAGLCRMRHHLAADRHLHRTHTGHLRHHVLKLLLVGIPQTFGRVAQHQIETDGAGLDADVFDGFGSHKILASQRVRHGLQGEGNVLFGHGHKYSNTFHAKRG